MHDKIQNLNHRLRSQSDMLRFKDEKNMEKVEQLEKKIHDLTNQVELAAQRKIKPLPFQKYQV